MSINRILAIKRYIRRVVRLSFMAFVRPRGVTIEHLAVIAVILVFYGLGTSLIRQKDLEVSYKIETPITLRHVSQKAAMKDDVPLPKILSDDDRDRYRKILSLQEEGEWGDADALIDKLDSKVLLGHVLAQRYLHQHYKSSKEELLAWIDQYSDHAEAYKIYRLAAKFDSSLNKVKNDVRGEYLYGVGDDSPLLSRGTTTAFKGKYWLGRNQAHKVWSDIHRMIRIGRVVNAHKLLQSSKAQRWLKPLEKDAAQWDVASGFFAYGKYKIAHGLAVDAASRSGEQLPQMYWTAGIISWQLGYTKQAVEFFTKVAEAKKLSTWERAAGSFWAFRGLRKLKDYERSRVMLEKAAEYPRTFYGMLAINALGKNVQYNWKWESLSDANMKELLVIPNVQRALAFRTLNRPHAAEAELRKVFPAVPLKTKKLLLGLAREMEFPALQAGMAKQMSNRNKGKLDYALSPIPPWKPIGGFRIDPALIFGIIKKESGFDVYARSHKSALGIMQIKPQTAKYMQKKFRVALEGDIDLYDPMVNMTLGQYYLEYLIRHQAVRGNLIFLLASYNAGPNRLDDWAEETVAQNDPLLFIETIPLYETRNYIQQVLANFWLYSDRLKQPAPSKEDLLQDRWPFY